MRLLRLILSIFLLAGLVFALPAQEDDSGEEDDDEVVPIQSDWTGSANLYRMGDQTFNISLGLVKPLFYVDQDKGRMETNMNLGGMGSIGYNFFLGPHLFLGGELSGMFASTDGKRMYFMVPMGVRVGYQFILKRFEFPLSLLVGFAPQSYKDSSYFGLFVKPTASAFFRFNPDWSFGLNSSFWWAPQWTSKELPGHGGGDIDIHGFFLEFSLSARYHF